jgi:integrase
MTLKRLTRKQLYTVINQRQKQIRNQRDAGLIARSTEKGIQTALETFKRTFPTERFVKDLEGVDFDHYFNTTLLNIKTEFENKADMRAHKLGEAAKPSNSNKKSYEGYADKTRQHIRSAVKDMFADLVAKGELRVNPIEKMSQPVRSVGNFTATKAYTTDEIKRLMDVRSEDGVVQAFLVGCEEGLRVSEVLALTAGNYCKSESTYKVTHAIVLGEMKETKTTESKRHITLSKLSCLIFNEIIDNGELLEYSHPMVVEGDEVECTNQFFFYNKDTDKYWWDSTHIYRALKPYFKLANVEFRGMQPCRHSFVNRAIESDREEKDVAAHIGHTNVHTLKKHYLSWEVNLRGSKDFRESRNEESMYHFYA